MKASTLARSTMPASDPRPAATIEPLATPNFMAPTTSRPSTSPALKPAENASPHPVVSTTAMSFAGTLISSPRLGV